MILVSQQEFIHELSLLVAQTCRVPFQIRRALPFDFFDPTSVVSRASHEYSESFCR